MPSLLEVLIALSLISISLLGYAEVELNILKSERNFQLLIKNVDINQVTA